MNKKDEPESSNIIKYRGRFAPSPTGSLHFGSLITAIASYLEAKTSQGKWFLRIDNADFLREQDKASDSIKRSLELHGFEWDGNTHYQSTSLTLYNQKKDHLIDNDYVFRCNCSRKNLRNNPIGLNGVIYKGTCRTKNIKEDFSIRVITEHLKVAFKDEIQGHQACQIDEDIGDFTIWRRDNIISYHLATVIDDNELGITNVVRGYDLLNSTFCQLYLQNILNYINPIYSHIPIATDANNQKLSKQFGAAELSNKLITQNLFNGLCALKQEPPTELRSDNLSNIWSWAIDNWSSKKLTMVKSITTLN